MSEPYFLIENRAVFKIVGTGSRICGHRILKEPNRRMRYGRISVAVAVGKTAGNLKFYAVSDGLKTGVPDIPLA